MSTKAIEAYDLPERVRNYDKDMKIMHPRRAKMVDVLLEILPHDHNAPVEVLDLGTGTGYLASRILESFPRARIAAVDAATAMLDLARERIGSACNVTLVNVDFRFLRNMFPRRSKFDMVVSSRNQLPNRRQRAEICILGDYEAARAYPDRMEAKEGDQPLPLAQDLDLLRSAGFRDTAVYWQEYREVVYAGMRPI